MNITIIRKRMKYMRIAVAPDGAIVVSAPKRVNNSQITAFIESRRAWIAKAQASFSKARELIQVAPGEMLLNGVGYSVDINPSHKKYDQVDNDTHTIQSSLDLTDPKIQKAWYIHYAKKYLAGLLQELAEKHGCNYAKIIIRDQKTKWGTCSQQRNIGLNRKLVKMPFAIQEYVICHELAHLTHLNHSKDFRSVVELYYPNYKQAEARMKKYGLGLQ